MQKEFGEKGREASFLSRSSLRRSRARWRDEAACVERGAQRRRSAHRSCTRARTPRQCQRLSAASAGPTPPLKNGLARLSPATTPGRGAQVPSTADACGGAFARAVARPFSDRAARAPHDHGGVGLAQLGRRARRSERQRSGGDAPEARGAGAKQRGALHARRRQPNEPIGLRGATRRVPEGGPRRGPWHAPCGAPVPFFPRPARRSRPWALPSHGARRRRACSAPSGLLVDAHDTIPRGARSGSTTRTTTPGTSTPRTSTKGRRLRLRAEGRRGCRSSRVAPAGAPAPRRHAP